MGLSPDGYKALCYSLASFLLACMTGYALYFGYRFRNKNTNTEAFITARGQVRQYSSVAGGGAGSTAAQRQGQRRRCSKGGQHSSNGIERLRCCLGPTNGSSGGQS